MGACAEWFETGLGEASGEGSQQRKSWQSLSWCRPGPENTSSFRWPVDDQSPGFGGDQAEGHRKQAHRSFDLSQQGPARHERREQLCFTAGNYKELVTLYEKFAGRDFEILAFPCNQFGGQEPGSNQQIKDFTKKYGVSFPITEKVDVNGPKTHPFFTYLKEKGPSGFLGKDAKWNFEKFLVDRQGNVVKRYLSTTSPLDIARDIESLL